MTRGRGHGEVARVAEAMGMERLWRRNVILRGRNAGGRPSTATSSRTMSCRPTTLFYVRPGRGLGQARGRRRRHLRVGPATWSPPSGETFGMTWPRGAARGAERRAPTLRRRPGAGDGLETNWEVKGHRVGDFPHPPSTMASAFEHCPRSACGSSIRSPIRPDQARYEDLLYSAAAGAT